MENPFELLIIWVAAASIASFALFGIDKYLARAHRRRIPERTLFLSAIIGGSPGALAGMYAFRHKTRHRSFTLGIPAILVCQAALVALLLR